MFLQQTFTSVGKVLPAPVAPLVIAELHADLTWVGVYLNEGCHGYRSQMCSLQACPMALQPHGPQP